MVFLVCFSLETILMKCWDIHCITPKWFEFWYYSLVVPFLAVNCQQFQTKHKCLERNSLRPHFHSDHRQWKRPWKTASFWDKRYIFCIYWKKTVFYGSEIVLTDNMIMCQGLDGLEFVRTSLTFWFRPILGYVLTRKPSGSPVL